MVFPGEQDETWTWDAGDTRPLDGKLTGIELPGYGYRWIRLAGTSQP